MGEGPPANLSFEDGYLQVAGVCDRAEYLERFTLYHASGKLPVSGWPNERGERQGIPPGDYRFAFGTDGRGAMAVRKNLAAKWLHEIRASQIAGWMGEQLPTPPPRRLLAENATEIDDRACRAIMRVCRRAKPGDAPAAYTDLQLGAKEFRKIIEAFRKAPSSVAPRPIISTAATYFETIAKLLDRSVQELAAEGIIPKAPRSLTDTEVRSMLSKVIIGEKERGKTFSQKKAVSLVQNIDPQFDREVVREIMRGLTGSRPRGRPKIIGGK